ncbi:hypothetical protein NVP1285O_38 [Vibrio phage 1.285.O._10N.286.55.C12]|nr:hypothetical protein NVP1285O_38 [Vibrio phage 1.285.O._10N.286.55.C12]
MIVETVRTIKKVKILKTVNGCVLEYGINGSGDFEYQLTGPKEWYFGPNVVRDIFTYAVKPTRKQLTQDSIFLNA